MSTRKKILYMASTASHLRRFHEPYIAALRERYDVFTLASGSGEVDFPVAIRKSLFTWRHIGEIRKIRRILKAERFDAVIVNTTLAAALLRLALRGVKPRPYVLNVVHGYLFSDPPRGLRDKLMLWVERKLAKRTDSIAVMNAHDLAVATKYRLCAGEVLFLHGMGIPPREIPTPDPELRMRYAAKKDYLLTFVGELSRRKNQIFLIRALAKLREKGLPVRLLLVGDGDRRTELIHEVGRLGLGESVFFAGNREPVQPYLAITDLYVSASASEGLPFNLLEAMQCGLPVIASDVRGQQDLLPPERLYPPDNEAAFCEAVRLAVASGLRGVGSVSYENIETYLLPSVFEENLKIFQLGVSYDKQN